MTVATITAVICTYDRYDLLPLAIESLVRQSLTPNKIEIIVVDNSPDAEKSAAFSKRFGQKNLKWITERTPGLSNARNVGIGIASAPLVAFMDDDAIAEPNWLESMASAFDRHGLEAVAAGGRVDPIWEIPRPNWLPDALLGFVSVVNWGGDTRFATEKEWVAGTNIAFRSEAIRKVGGFAVHLGRNKGGQALLSNDETEVMEKLRANGGRLLYVPDAVVRHLVAAERLTQSWFRRRVAWQAVSEYLQNPKAMYEAAPRYWRDVVEYYSLMPPKYKSPRGLWVEQSDPELFRRQMSAIYNFTISSLAGFHDLQPA